MSIWISYKSIFYLKIGLLFHHIFTLFLCFYYMFNKYKKPSFYFPYHDPFITFIHSSPMFIYIYTFNSNLFKIVYNHINNYLKIY